MPAFVRDLDASTLSDGDRHHLEARLLAAVDGLTVGDGAGRFRVVRFGPQLGIDGDVEVAAPKRTDP